MGAFKLNGGLEGSTIKGVDNIAEKGFMTISEEMAAGGVMSLDIIKACCIGASDVRV